MKSIVFLLFTFYTVSLHAQLIDSAEAECESFYGLIATKDTSEIDLRVEGSKGRAIEFSGERFYHIVDVVFGDMHMNGSIKYQEKLILARKDYLCINANVSDCFSLDESAICKFQLEKRAKKKKEFYLTNIQINSENSARVNQLCDTVIDRIRNGESEAVAKEMFFWDKLMKSYNEAYENATQEERTKMEKGKELLDHLVQSVVDIMKQVENSVSFNYMHHYLKISRGAPVLVVEYHCVSESGEDLTFKMTFSSNGSALRLAYVGVEQGASSEIRKKG